MLWFWLAAALLVLLAAVVLIAAILLRLRRMLTMVAVREIEALIAAALVHADHRLKIIELDKVLDVLLSKLGHTGTLGEKLKKAGARFPNANALWSAHKLRNTLAHEPGAAANDADVERVRTAIVTALRHVTPRRS